MGWNLQGMDFARNANYVVSITVPKGGSIWPAIPVHVV